MEWSKTFTGIVAISADIFTASVFWKHADVTVSSLCGLELRKSGGIWSLRVIGRLLNRIQTDHCERAIASDIERAREALTLLGAKEENEQLREALQVCFTYGLAPHDVSGTCAWEEARRTYLAIARKYSWNGSSGVRRK